MADPLPSLIKGLLVWPFAAGLLATLVFVVVMGVVFWWNRKLD